MSSSRNPQINIYSHDVPRLVAFHESLGSRETFRTPDRGTPVHVELTLDQFTLGLASVEAAIAGHGLNPELGGRPVRSCSGPTTSTVRTGA
jgi:lactoylglutathione lyase